MSPISLQNDQSTTIEQDNSQDCTKFNLKIAENSQNEEVTQKVEKIEKKSQRTLFFEKYDYKPNNKTSSQVSHPQELLDCTYSPSEINFRPFERQKIEDFLVQNIEHNTKIKCLLLTGNPGTGKTLLLTTILDEFQQFSTYLVKKQQKLEKIRIIRYNGMRYRGHMEFFRQLWQDIVNKNAYGSGPGFMQMVEDILDVCQSRWENEKIVVMIDEFDSLFSTTKETKEMFEIFSLCQSLILIGISNSMEMFQNLKEKYSINDGKINLDKIENIVFQPYSHKDMAEICKQRIQQIKDQFNLSQDLFTEKAINFTSNVVYNKGGDIRVLLDVCKRALQKQLGKLRQNQFEDQDYTITPAQLQNLQPLSIANLSNIVEEMYSSQKNIQIIQHLPRDIKITLIAMHNIIIRDESILQIKIMDILYKTHEITNKMGLQNLDLESISEHLKTLEHYQIASIRGQGQNTFTKNGFKPKTIGGGQKQIQLNQQQVFLKINLSEISKAFKNDDSGLGCLLLAE